MRWLLPIAIVCSAFSLTGCEVKVEDNHPDPIVKPERKVDINVDAPGVDVKVKRD